MLSDDKSIMQEVLKLQEMNMKQKLSFRKKKISENERKKSRKLDL